MATYTFVDLNIPEAELLADLCGIDHDLETTNFFAEELKKQWSLASPNIDLLDALSTAIVVRYTRSFVTGVRTKLDDGLLSRLSEQRQSAHEHLRARRDKHVAHSVNSFEENQPVIRYSPETLSEEGIAGVGCRGHRRDALTPAEVDQIVDLVNAVRGLVRQDIHSETCRLLDIVRRMPRDQVISTPRRELGGADNQLLLRRRK